MAMSRHDSAISTETRDCRLGRTLAITDVLIDINLDGHGQLSIVRSLDMTTKKRENYLTWDEYFMATAFLSAQRSKDPVTQVALTAG